MEPGAARPTGDFLDGLEAGLALIAELLAEFEAARVGGAVTWSAPAA